jgi:hypothetical protein
MSSQRRATSHHSLSLILRVDQSGFLYQQIAEGQYPTSTQFPPIDDGGFK